jgi:competence protein ComEA
MKTMYLVARTVTAFLVAVFLLSAEFSLAADQAVDLNAASATELAALKGIGPAKAQAIVDYRETNGTFGSVDELKMVRGIGDKLLEQLRSQVTVGSAGSAPREAKEQAAKR